MNSSRRTPKDETPAPLLAWACGFVSMLALGGAVLWTATARSGEGEADPVTATLDEVKAKVYASLDPLDVEGFEKLGPPKPGEWLSIYPEPVQPLETYKLQKPTRATPQRRTIVLKPLGTFSAERRPVLEAMRAYAEAFFQLPARIDPEVALTAPEGKPDLFRIVPMGNRHGSYDKQYDGERILTEVLKPRLPADAAVCLGITMEDLWADDLTYVFGLGSFKHRVGVYSLARYYPEFWGRRPLPGDDVKGLLRSCKVLNHETGHMFGLTHCVFYRCSMNGSNSLPETDAAPIHFCPVCHRKLAWNLRFDPLKRYGDLEAFYAKQGLSTEAEWIGQRRTRWKTLAAREARTADPEVEPGE
ncbi:MAG: hypothetical protein AMXMBFR7_20400 [Planctomycetota bacterium]